MAWFEANGVDYMLGPPTNAVLRADPEIVKVADARAVKLADEQHSILRKYTDTRYTAKSATCQGRVAARIEASTMGMDIRHGVTAPKAGAAKHIYDTLYYARGQAENPIRLHKTQLASDRTSSRSATANETRLFLHTAAIWLLWRAEQKVPEAPALNTATLATGEFTTLRRRLIKVVARVIESATRIRVARLSMPRCRSLPGHRHRLGARSSVPSQLYCSRLL